MRAASKYEEIQAALRSRPKRWVVTGAAGFIGSHLLETLLKLNQYVTGFDNFATGHRHNLEEVRGLVSPEQWGRFTFIEGDIRDLGDCRAAFTSKSQPIDYVLHQAALGSVPRSIEDPLSTNSANIDGFLNMLVVSRDAEAMRFVYAASSSTYGDHPDLPKVEHKIGRPLSPYAITKYVNELYAEVFGSIYGLQSIGLRYFNIFGQRQDPGGAYAAVIPKWIDAMIGGKPVHINGDGETSRDFCYVANAVQANILAATTDNPAACNEVYNIAVGQRTSLNELYHIIQGELKTRLPQFQSSLPIYRNARQGDVRHSLANIEKAQSRLGYQPTYSVTRGLEEAMGWYVKHLGETLPRPGLI